MLYQTKPMPLDPKSIGGISEKVLVSHYENNYVSAVKRLNSIAAQLADLDFAQAPNFVINGLKREELVASNSMILHEIYFNGLGGTEGPRGALAEAIARDFGSMARWRAEFSAIGRAEGGGSGRVILSFSPRDGRLRNHGAADHTTTLAGGRPVLVLDMYEHAYHMDFGASAARYVVTPGRAKLMGDHRCEIGLYGCLRWQLYSQVGMPSRPRPAKCVQSRRPPA
ncbi:superoxide dismutase [Bradyrhizobium sp. SRS-191]|uniref:superoxide dismutase n=1 Tax=Bradyrhizobium sp. SRS-191 TaxID=2962606 RepID=UPI00211EF2CF|nr:Fe-Mn family superoxide dismutase [Bradyrhizobium sp. SRS-191]